MRQAGHRTGAAAVRTLAAAALAMAVASGQMAQDSAAQDPAAGTGYDPLARPANPMTPGQPPTGESDVKLNPELGNLPDTPGAEETFYLCSACHSLAIVKQQRISSARWDYLWTWMIEEQGMPEQDPETREKILTYLERHFSWERPAEGTAGAGAD